MDNVSRMYVSVLKYIAKLTLGKGKGCAHVVEVGLWLRPGSPSCQPHTQVFEVCTKGKSFFDGTDVSISFFFILFFLFHPWRNGENGLFDTLGGIDQETETEQKAVFQKYPYISRQGLKLSLK